MGLNGSQIGVSLGLNGSQGISMGPNGSQIGVSLETDLIRRDALWQEALCVCITPPVSSLNQ